MNELWQPVVGYEGLYEVSDQGRVRSLDRVVKCKRPFGGISERPQAGKVLSLGTRTNNNGRKFAHISKGGVSRSPLVHRLVAAAFIGPCPKGFEVDHVNGDPLDNRACNLEYVTHEENIKRAVELGKIAFTGKFKSMSQS